MREHAFRGVFTAAGTMSEQFDPYLQWLGIRDPGRPPNYYRLLGVELFESDPDVLLNAADRQMAHVRTFQTGRHSAESQRMLNELAAAKVCLLNPQKKAEYDAQLWGQLQAASQACAPAAPPLAAPEEAPPPPTIRTVAPTSVRPGRKPRYFLAVITVLVSMIVVLLALTLLMSGFGGPEQRPDRVAARREFGTAAGPGTRPDTKGEPDAGAKAGPGVNPGAIVPPENGVEPKAGTRPRLNPQPPSGVQPEPQTQREPQTQPQANTQPGAESVQPRPGSVSEAIEAARAAMTARDPEAARRHLAWAEQLAQPRDRGQIAQLQEAISPLSAFWRVVRRGMRELKPGEALGVAGRQVTVTGVTADSLTVRDGEQEEQYTAATLPPEVALAIADRKLPDLPASLLSKAAFLIFDPRGDQDLARQLCGDAEGQGLSADALLAELDRATAPPEEPPKADAASRLPVPDAAALSGARQKVQEVFEDRYAAAQKPEEKAALARVLLNQAIDTTDNPVARYVLFVEARDLAVQAGSASLLSEAVEETAKRYQVDEREEMTKTLCDAVGRPLPPAAKRDLAVEAVCQAEKAIRDDDYQTAATLARAANTLALKGKDSPVAKQANKLTAEIPLLNEQHQSSLAAAQALAADPGNPQASLALGKYCCFFRREQQWEQGLPLLAQGDDPTLSALARAEAGVTASSAAAEKVQLADRWYEASKSVDEEIREQVQARAVFWYQESLGELSGFTKTRVEKLLEEARARTPDRHRP